jgi:hypothetical protein
VSARIKHWIALDASISSIEAEHRLLSPHSFTLIDRGRKQLSINRAKAVCTILKVEDAINKWLGTRWHTAHFPAAGVHAAKQCQRIDFLNTWQAPVLLSGQRKGVRVICTKILHFMVRCLFSTTVIKGVYTPLFMVLFLLHAREYGSHHQAQT